MINVNRYIINYTKFVTSRIPVKIRYPEIVAWVLWLALPIVVIYNLLIVFRNFVLYNLTITPQVVYLQKMLNDKYDDDERRIYIEDGISYLPLFLYTRGEENPVFIYRRSEANPKYVFTRGEVGQSTNDFVVYVPNEVEFNEQEMRTLLTSFKLASKSFKISIF